MNRQHRLAHVVALVMISVCVLAVPALAQDCPELVGRWPFGPAYAVAVSGGHAYFGSGAALVVADVADPSAPHRVGEVALPGLVKAVAVAGGYAFVAADRGGLRVIDVSTPSTPVEVGFVDMPSSANGVAVEGAYAYIANDYHGLRVIDVSTPSAPAEVGFVDTSGTAIGIAVAGGYAYMANDYSYLRVIDVSTPSAPVEVGFLDVPGRARGVAVSGNYVCVADDYPGLRVIDVSTPTTPVEVGLIQLPGNSSGVAVAGGYAYVANEMHGLRVVDVSTPSAPVEVSSIDTTGLAYGVAVEASHAYAAARDAGLRVIDVVNPSAPVEVGFVDASGTPSNVAVSAGYAFVAADDSGLRVIDVRTPSASAEVGFIETPGAPGAVAVAGAYVYVLDGIVTPWGPPYVETFRVIDVSSPSAPVEMGFLDGGGSALTVVGGYAYVVRGYSLRVIDVRTPSAPADVGSLEMPGSASGVAVAGGYAYVAAGWAGLRVIDVRTPSAPVEMGFAETSASAQSVAVSGGYAYVASGRPHLPGEGGLAVIDVSTPSVPVEVGFVETPVSPYNVAVSRGYAYVAGWEAGLSVIDVSTPSAPVIVGSFNTPGVAVDVAASGGEVFVLDYDAGLYVFRDCAGGMFPDGHESFIPAAAVAAGAEGAFFQTDVEVNNTGTDEAQIYFEWLPRGEENSEPALSDLFSLSPGRSLRFENALTELFRLGPDSLGALKMVASTESVIGMSRTYNSPGRDAAGTFGQGLPAIRATEMIQGSEPQRIIFLSESDDSRTNVGCVNGSSEPVTINIGMFNAEGESLETKIMDLDPYSNNQINRIFEDYAPVNGYVDVWADSDEALYYCYGSMLDNSTSDPTTTLPQVPSAVTVSIPAAALAAGLEGAFFETDIELNNVGSTNLKYHFIWHPRGVDNSDPVVSDFFWLASGVGVRYANVLEEVFGLEPDQIGAVDIEASEPDLLAMSRTYNLPSAKVASTFGQGLPGIPADRMIPTGVKKRILFLSEDDDVRANLGCINGVGTEVAVQIELYDSEGVKLETKYMMLPPYSNRQINGIFQDYAPVNGYVDVRTYTPDAAVYCYGSVLDNLTSDPTTVLPQ